MMSAEPGHKSPHSADLCCNGTLFQRIAIAVRPKLFKQTSLREQQERDKGELHIVCK